MRRTWTCAAALLAVIVVIAGSGAIASAPAPNRTELTRSYTLPYRIAQAPASDAMETVMLTLLNQSRRAVGLRPLWANTTLRWVARTHGADMFAHGYLSHQSRDGRLPLDRIEGAGLSPWHIGENLAYARTVPDAHRLLMNSPGHRANILSPVYRRIGIGVMDGGADGVIVVEDFTD
ncbi:MAG TPA: CAP domain-containing protein [bacterium]|nr:CAP domain-containing protein [bacterium]